MRHFAPTVVVFLAAMSLLAAEPEPQAGPNVIANPGFRTSLQYWAPFYLTAQWSPIDRLSSSSSGSALLRNTDATGNVAGELVQCVTVIPGKTYSAAAAYMAPTGQARTGAVYFSYSFGTPCGTADPSHTISTGVQASLTDGAWHGLSTQFIVPQSTLYVRLAIKVGKYEPGGEFRLNIDDVSLTEEQPQVYVDGPPTGFAAVPITFQSSANACSPTGIDWNWSATGSPSVVGERTRRPVFTWSGSGTFNVTATNPACPGASASKSISIAAVAPKIVVIATPKGMAQGEVTTDSFAFANLGGSSTTVSLALQNGTYFSISPASFALAPGATRVVNVSSSVGKAASGRDLPQQTPAAVNAAADIVNVSGVGVPAGTKIALTMMLAGPSSGGAVVRPDSTRVDVAGDPAAPGPSGTVTFTNTGNAPMLAAVVPTTSWISPGQTTIEIPAGASRTLSFLIDRARRPDAQAPLGSQFGDLLLLFRRLGLAGKAPMADPGIAGVTVVDTARPSTTAAGIPALAAGEYALFVPGVGHKRGSVGLFISDLALLNLGTWRSVDGLRMYYLPIGGAAASAQQSGAISLTTDFPIAVADTVNSTFGGGDSIGTLQIRSTPSYQVLYLSVGATVFNVSNPSGTYGTALPVFRSDRATKPGGVICLTGLRKDASSHTNIYIQETAGKGATANVDFLSSTGTVLASRGETLAGFAMTQWSDAVPNGAVSAVVTNATGSAGQVSAFATPVDRASGDTWAVADWAAYYGYTGSQAITIPTAGSVHGANLTWFRSDVAMMNVDTAPVTVTMRYYPRGAAMIEKTIQLAARETRVLADVVGGLFGVTGDSVGSVVATPPYPSNVRVTSRTYTTVAGQAATYGTGVPALATYNEAYPGDVRRIGGLEDASLATIGAARPGTFRTNFGIVATRSAARVLVRLRYDGVSGDSALAASRGVATREYTLAAHELVLLSNVAREILGAATRDAQFGDMRNLDVEFQVLEGTVIPFVTSTDNGTGDTVFRAE